MKRLAGLLVAALALTLAPHAAGAAQAFGHLSIRSIGTQYAGSGGGT